MTRIEIMELALKNAADRYARDGNNANLQKAIRQAIAEAESQESVGDAYLCDKCSTPFDGAWECPSCGHNTSTKEPVYIAPPKQDQGEPVVAWISVKDELPKAVRGVSYKASLTDTVLVRHADRPDYPITAHAVVGEGLGAGIAIPTEGASEHPEIAWYSASSDLNNPFGLKNQDYERFLPKIFGKKITHWMPIPTTPQQRKPLTDEQLRVIENKINPNMRWRSSDEEGITLYPIEYYDLVRAIEAAHGIKE